VTERRSEFLFILFFVFFSFIEKDASCREDARFVVQIFQERSAWLLPWSGVFERSRTSGHVRWSREISSTRESIAPVARAVARTRVHGESRSKLTMRQLCQPRRKSQYHPAADIRRPAGRFCKRLDKKKKKKREVFDGFLAMLRAATVKNWSSLVKRIAGPWRAKISRSLGPRAVQIARSLKNSSNSRN